MEIRNLITFTKIAETKNFSKAAEQLGYSQSAVTMQIKQLESEIHAKLFERIGRQVKLTESGERLLPYALDILNTLQKVEHIASEPEEISGPLRIGTSDSFVTSILPTVLSDFLTICPHSEVSVQTALVSDLFQGLRQNEYDCLLFLEQKLYFPEWIKVLESPVKIHFVTNSDSPLVNQKQIPLSRIMGEPLYLTEKGVSYRYFLEQILAENGTELHPFLEVGNTDILVRFLLAHSGISFLPDYVVRPYLTSGELSILDVSFPDVTLWIQLVYHKNKCVTPQLSKFIDLMMQHT